MNTIETPRYYTIRHHTRFRYSAPIAESQMELRMCPLSEEAQNLFRCDVSIRPSANVLKFVDYSGCTIHHFTIPQEHSMLTIEVESFVEVRPDRLTALHLPDALNQKAWTQLDALVEKEDYADYLLPSTFARQTDLLHEFARELHVDGRYVEESDDPLSVLRRITAEICERFQYRPNSTDVNSPIDQALAARHGVCQDYAHIMIALVRNLGIPCRYVSGYLYYDNEHKDQSAEDATHAWVEALLPDLGWIGFDPTNNILAKERHIRVAVGRDYADVPPTRGVFRGDAETELDVSVNIILGQEPEEQAEALLPAVVWPTLAMQQQQQQQQQ